MADKQSLTVRLKFQKHAITPDGHFTSKSRIVVSKLNRSPPPLMNDQSGHKTKHAKFAGSVDVNDAVEDPGSDASLETDTAGDYNSRLANLCKTGMSDNELMLLPADQVNGVSLLQLRLTRNIQDLVDAYDILHGDEPLQQTTIKKAFSSAFKDIAKHNGVPVNDLKAAYNSISTASQARKSEGKVEIAPEPSDLPKRTSRAPPRLRDAKPTVNPTTSKKAASRKAAPKKSPPKKAPKPEIIGASEEPLYPAFERFEGEIEVEERLEELIAKGADLPRLPFYHSLYRSLNETQDFDTLTTEQLREIDHVRRLYTSDEIAQAVNTMTPGCTTRETVKALLKKVQEELVLPEGKDNAHDEETDTYLPEDELLNRRAPHGPHGYNGRMWN